MLSCKEGTCCVEKASLTCKRPCVRGRKFCQRQCVSCTSWPTVSCVWRLERSRRHLWKHQAGHPRASVSAREVPFWPSSCGSLPTRPTRRTRSMARCRRNRRRGQPKAAVQDAPSNLRLCDPVTPKSKYMIHPQCWTRISEENHHHNLGKGDEQLTVPRFMIMTPITKITQSSLMHRCEQQGRDHRQCDDAAQRRSALW